MAQRLPCGTQNHHFHQASPHAIDQNERMQRRRLAGLCIQCIEVETVFHVISPFSSDSPIISNDEIEQQLRLINEHFGQTPFLFRLSTTTQTYNDEWALGAMKNDGKGTDALASQISASLRVGGPDVANVFLVSSVCSSFGGFASVPFEKGMFPLGMYSKTDFIFLCPAEMKINDALLTHEMGHWMGLLHIWSQGCDDKGGDLVDDTPIQLGPTGSCTNVDPQKPKDSCPSQPGFDMSNNFMDYSDCMSKFTVGQVERMYHTFNSFRRRVEPCHDDETGIYLEFFVSSSDVDSIDVGYSEWGKENGYWVSMMPDAADRVGFSNQVFSREFCIPKRTLHEFFFDHVNIDSVVLRINGRKVVTPSTPNSDGQISLWVYGDGPSCWSRFTLDLTFGQYPQSIHWRLRHNEMFVADASDTFSFGATEYIGNLADSVLFVDLCIDQSFHGDYNFTLWDDLGPPLDMKFKVALDGKEILPEDPEEVKSPETVFFATTLPNFALAAQAPTQCFSAASTVKVKGKAKEVRMDQLQIGDLVLVGNDVYEPIYSFGHYDPDSRASFLQIETDLGLLEISQDHMIFVSPPQGPPIPAALLRMADRVYDFAGNELEVKSIRAITLRGKYAPFTPSGKLVVNGVLVSSYVALVPSHSLTILGVSFSFQWLAHSFEFPHRLVCYHMGNFPKETFSDSGISDWVNRPLKLSQFVLDMGDYSIVKAGLLAIILVAFLVFDIIEYSIFLIPHWIVTTAGFLAIAMVCVGSRTWSPKLVRRRKISATAMHVVQEFALAMERNEITLIQLHCH